MMLALAVPDVESDPYSDPVPPQPAPARKEDRLEREPEAELAARRKRKEDEAAQKRAIEEEEEEEKQQTRGTREAELERRLKEDHEMIDRLKQELDQARAAAEEAQRERREAQRVAREPEAQAVAQEAAVGDVGPVDGGAAMPVEWDTEVLMESDLPSITDLVNQPELISDFLAMADPPSIPHTTTLPPSFPSSSSSSSSSLHASPIPGAANPPLGVWPAPPMAWGPPGHRSVGHTHSPTSPLTAAASPTFPPSSTRLPQPCPKCHHHQRQQDPTTSDLATERGVDVLLPLPAPPPHSDQIQWRSVRFALADDQETVASLRSRALARWHLWHAEAVGARSSNEEEAEAARAAAEAAADGEQGDWVITSSVVAIQDTETSVWAILLCIGLTSNLWLQRK